jgi:hypothetical protein
MTLPVTTRGLGARGWRAYAAAIQLREDITMHRLVGRRAAVPLGCLCAAVLLLCGCATTTVDARWRNVQTPAGYLRGATVLVACEAPEVVLVRLCEDRMSAALAAHGARPVLAAPGEVAAAQPGAPDMQYLPVARRLGAASVMVVGIGLASQRVSQGISIGIGGFGFGRYSAGGVGVSAPIGGGQVSAGYAADGRLTDLATGRLMWTARASAPPSSDVNDQIDRLAGSLVEAAASDRLF